jgi:hypothetical protein
MLARGVHRAVWLVNQARYGSQVHDSTSSSITFRHPYVTKFHWHAIENTLYVDSKESLVVFRIVTSHVPQFSGSSSAIHYTCISSLSLLDTSALVSFLSFPDSPSHSRPKFATVSGIPCIYFLAIANTDLLPKCIIAVIRQTLRQSLHCFSIHVGERKEGSVLGKQFGCRASDL